MHDRISSVEVARAMDEVLEKAGLRVPNRLHRIIAECTGLHPTTVLRYHRQELESADVRVLECIHDIGQRIQNGENLFLHDDEGEIDSGSGNVDGTFNVSVHELGRWFEKLRVRLESPSISILYQWVEDQLDIPSTTVMRYHSGELRGAPGTILHALRTLERALIAGEPVVMRWGPGDDGQVVPRRALVALIDEMQELGLVAPGRKLMATIATRLELDPEDLQASIANDEWPFVSLSLYESIRKLRDDALYDPRNHYHVGDRLWFPDLGTGTVLEKLPKHRMRVEFDRGMQRLLREDVWVDPRSSFPLA